MIKPQLKYPHSSSKCNHNLNKNKQCNSQNPKNNI